MSVVTGLVAFAAMTALALRMAPHRRAALGSAAERVCTRFAMTLLGAGLLALSLGVAVRGRGWAVGLVEWFAAWAVGGLVVTLLLTYRPRGVLAAAVAGLVLAGIWMLMAAG